MKRSISALILIISAFFIIFTGSAYGQNTAPIDLVLLLDTSSAMSPSYENVNNYLTGPFLTEFLRVGDTFHLIAFSSNQRLDVARRINGVGDVETIIGRILLQYPVENAGNVSAALTYAEQYVTTLPSRSKKIVLVTLGSSNASGPVAGVRQRLSSSGSTIDLIQVTPGQPLSNLPVSGRTAATTATAATATATPPASSSAATTAPPAASSTSTTAPVSSSATTTAPASSTTTTTTTTTTPSASSSTTATTTPPVSSTTTPASSTTTTTPASSSTTTTASTSSTTATTTPSASTTTTPSTTTTTTPISTTPDSSTTTIPESMAEITTQPSDSDISPQTSIISNERLDTDTTGSSQTQTSGTVSSDTKEKDSQTTSAALVTPGRLKETKDRSALTLPIIIALIILLLIILGLLIFFFLRKTSGSSSGRSVPFSDDTPTREESSFDDHSKELATYAAGQTRQRTTPYDNRVDTNKPVVINPSGPLLLNLFVYDQNTNIGKRNIHSLKTGYSLSVGGGNADDFLIFLVPIPAHIGEIKRNGSQLTFIPRKPKYFPDIGSSEVKDCINKTIRIISDKNYEMRFRFEMYEDPLIALNRLLHSVKVPG